MFAILVFVALAVSANGQNCGEPLSGASGTFASPNYPDRNYPHNSNCQWDIVVASGAKVLLQFSDFALEGPSVFQSGGPCVDYVEIYDLFAPNYFVGKWCGDDKPPIYLSASNNLVVRFVSDWITKDRGFQASYSTFGGTVTTTTATPVACGSPAISPSLARVVGGTTAVANSWPWMASLAKYGAHACGGSLIAPGWILTAAHCFDGASYTSQWTVRLGSHTRESTDARQQNIGVQRIVIHEGYNGASSSDNDIALLKLNHDATINNYVSPVCVAPGEFPSQTSCYISLIPLLRYLRRAKERERNHPGKLIISLTACLMYHYFTGANFQIVMADQLQQGEVEIIDWNTCNSANWYGGDVSSNMLCAGWPMGQTDACQNDSGGPLVCKSGRKWYQAGVVSWGHGCAQPNKPGVYTDVMKYQSWIQTKMAQYP
ncbi:serine protease 33-like [Branchiostoma lanceolatum]|uniref:serine protease 33-like n=1 Tax=Branchiostoma lanceolatum TaxID=7740 RepID=UPI0034524F1C